MGSGQIRVLPSLRLEDISILAPRMGSGGCPLSGFSLSCRFQSSLPAWGAATKRFLIYVLLSISILAPRMGSGSETFEEIELVCISILAPRMGSGRTYRLTFAYNEISILAPRMGSGLFPVMPQRSFCSFQSSLPAWGAAVTPFSSVTVPSRISILAPRMGSGRAALT